MTATAIPSSSSSSSSARRPIREVFPRIRIGRHAPGASNSIVDVPGVLVATASLHKPNTSAAEPVPGAPAHIVTKHAVHTGATVILPRADWHEHACYAGLFSFNGCGEVTGAHWIEESGKLGSPVVLTGSWGVGAAYSGILQHYVQRHRDEHGLAESFLLAVVAETYDGFLSDVGAMPMSPAFVADTIAAASAQPIPQGNTGGGTGMLCHGFKGGSGSASRLIPGTVSVDGRKTDVTYTVAAFVQANYGMQYDLHIGRVPVGRLMMDPEKRKELEREIRQPREPGPEKDGSIIIVLATDAPLLPVQLKRLAKRATVGLARVGGLGTNSSGDIFLAFSTAEHLKPDSDTGRFDTLVQQQVGTMADNTINALFEAVADATEEAIYNVLCMAETMEGPLGRTAHAIDLDELAGLLDKHYVD